jgi:Fe-S cluster assembly iron-binding protein IscA
MSTHKPKVCKFDGQCKNQACTFRHLEKKEVCKFDGRCKNQACTFRHLKTKKKTMCRFEITKGGCTNQACTFRHLETKKTKVCKFDGRCKNQACTFRHLETKKKTKKTMCRFEITKGGCTNSNCRFGHRRDEMCYHATTPGGCTKQACPYQHGASTAQATTSATDMIPRGKKAREFGALDAHAPAWTFGGTNYPGGGDVNSWVPTAVELAEMEAMDAVFDPEISRITQCVFEEFAKKMEYDDLVGECAGEESDEEEFDGDQ